MEPAGDPVLPLASAASRAMKVLFAFENPLPSTAADAEVFVTTARHLAPLVCRAWLHIPLAAGADRAAVSRLAGLPVVRACAPIRPAALRHFCCGLTIVFRREFREADLVYTRNLWIAWMATRFGRDVVFDHYRPWPDQIPPLQPWLYRLMRHRHFRLNICHSDYTLQSYRRLRPPAGTLACVRNGFDPQRFATTLPGAAAKRRIGLGDQAKTVVYTGRLNHKKGLDLVIEAARRLPDIVFILVGSAGDGPIERMARTLDNVRIVAWQPAEALTEYVHAADVLLIPPSSKPLAEFGSTVLPLKLFYYMASSRPILAGATPDVMEVLEHRRNGFLCRPDCAEALVGGISALLGDPALAAALAAAALADSRQLTWQSRAGRIAALVGDPARAGSAARGGWGRSESLSWLGQSWRWLAHLITHRSWVLPPPSPLSTAPPQASRR